MNYGEMKAWLIKSFQEKGFEEQLDAKNWRSLRILAPSPKTEAGDIYITFPGYKSRVSETGIVYDYRVDAAGREDIAISHVNILVDIFEKVRKYPQTGEEFTRFLIDLAENGCDVRLEKYPGLLKIPPVDIDRRLTAQMKKVHTQLTKKYNVEGNGWSYSIAELADYIPWIVLQEDINYPMPVFLGRRMPFYRYLEAVYCAVYFRKTAHRISDVAIRALSHRRVEQWADTPEIPYEKIEKIGRKQTEV